MSLQDIAVEDAVYYPAPGMTLHVASNNFHCYRPSANSSPLSLNNSKVILCSS